MTSTEAKHRLSAGDMAGTEALCRRAVLADPQDAEALHRLGASLHRQGRLEESAEALWSAVRLAPGNPHYRISLAATLGRKLPDNEQESQSYDTFGRPWVHTDFAGDTATDTYVGTSDVPHEGLLASVQYVGYTGSGKPTETVQYSYDSLERKTQSTDTIGSTVITTNYGYDESGGYQLNGSSLSGDVDGLLTSVKSAISGGSTLQVHYVYDAATQRLIETWTGTGAITAATTDTLYGYDALGRLESVSVQKQNGATPTQNTSNTTRYGPTGTAISTTLPTTVYNYDAVGRPLSTLYPNGTETDYDWSNYWATGTEVVTNKRGGTTLSTFTYTFDAARRKTQDTETVLNVNEGSSVTGTFIWAYDDLNRLTSEQFTDGVTADAYKATYSYDLAGNRYQKKSYLAANYNGSTPDHTYTDTYNNDDQLTQEVDTSNGSVNTTTLYGYDSNGSTTSKVVKNSNNVTIESDTYVSDARNRMTSATVAGTASSDTYNDDGDRVVEAVGSTTNTFLVDGKNPTSYSQVLETWQGGTNPAVAYTLGSAVIAQNSAGTVSYLMPDGHGSTRQLTAYTTDSSNGHVMGRYDYDAFGNQLSLSGLPANVATTLILYTGQQFDQMIGQYYLRARYYSAGLGRFTSEDVQAGTGNLANANLYLYVGGNPITLRDPSGRDGIGELLVAAAIIFVVASLLDKNYANAPEVVFGPTGPAPGPIFHAQPFAGNDAIEWAILGGGFSRLQSFFRPLLQEVGLLRPVGNELIGQVAPAGITEAQQAAQALTDSADELPSMTFRGDTRPPDQVFNDGFQAKGSNMNLREYVFNNPSDAGYVGTSRSMQQATSFANHAGDGGYVYFVRPTGGVNVNAVFGTTHIYAEELEIAVPHAVPSSDIIGAMRVGADGRLTGELILNQNFTATAN